MQNYKSEKLLKFLKLYMKMDQINITLDDTEIEKYKFQQYESAISISNIDINKIVQLIRFLSVYIFYIYFSQYKCFIGYKDAKMFNKCLYKLWII